LIARDKVQRDRFAEDARIWSAGKSGRPDCVGLPTSIGAQLRTFNDAHRGLSLLLVPLPRNVRLIAYEFEMERRFTP
jgi:hypothetical protein